MSDWYILVFAGSLFGDHPRGNASHTMFMKFQTSSQSFDQILDTNQLEVISFMQKMMGMFPATIPLLSLLPESRWFSFRFSSETCVDAWLDKCKVSFHSRPRLTWYFENVKLNTLMLGDISKEIQTYSGKIFENFPTKKWAYTRQTSSLYSGNGEICTLYTMISFHSICTGFLKMWIF